MIFITPASGTYTTLEELSLSSEDPEVLGWEWVAKNFPSETLRPVDRFLGGNSCRRNWTGSARIMGYADSIPTAMSHTRMV
jgi:hypothetical protein